MLGINNLKFVKFLKLLRNLLKVQNPQKKKK